VNSAWPPDDSKNKLPVSGRNEADPEVNSIRISGTIDIYGASDFRDQLRRELQERADVSLDLSSVEGCDACGLQTLISAITTACRSGKRFRIAAQSGAITRVSEELGINLSELLSSQAK
jgi:anti-anti-sigma factor